MKKRGFLASAAVNLFANATASILSAFAILVVIRALSISDWGRTAALLGTGQLLGSLLSFGTPALLIRELSTLRVAPYRRQAFTMTLMRSMTGLAVLVFGLLILTTVQSDAGSIVILAAGVFVSLGSTVGFIARRRYVVAAAVLLSEKLVALACLVVLAGFHVLTPAVVCCVMGAAGAMAGLLASGLLRRRGHTSLRLMVTAARRQWLGSLHFGIAAVAPSFLLLDTVLVAHVCGASEAGAYAVGSRLLAPLSFVSTTLAQTLMPVLAVHGPGARISWPNRRRLFLIVGTVVSVVSILLSVAPSIAVWVLGSEYQAAAWPIRFFVLNAAAVLVTRTLATALQAWRYELLVSVLVSTNVVIALLGVLLGAWAAGAGAAAAGVFAANIMLAISLAVAIRKVRRRSLASTDLNRPEDHTLQRLT